MLHHRHSQTVEKIDSEENQDDDVACQPFRCLDLLEGNVRQHRKVEQLKEGGAEMQPQMNRMRLPEQQMMAADSSFDMQEERMTFPKNFHLE